MDKEKNISLIGVVWGIITEGGRYWFVSIIPAVLAILQEIRAEVPEQLRDKFMISSIYDLLPNWGWFLIAAISFFLTVSISTYKYLKKSIEKIPPSNTTTVTANNGSQAINVHGDVGSINPLNRTRPLDIGEVDISLESLSRDGGEYVSIKVTNNNQNNPVFCKAIIRKKEWFKQDPKNADGGEWIPINTDENGPLSWHFGGTDNEGFKKVHFNPEFINIARAWAKHDMNYALRGHIMFTYIVQKPAKAGRYKIWIDIYCKMGEKSTIETWIGCIDMANPMRSDMLTIMECEDVKEWKQDQGKD